MILARSIAARPFIKWAGGKRDLIPQFQPFFPSHYRTYHEPFIGGGAVFFHLQPEPGRGIISDVNPKLINVYRVVQQKVEALIAELTQYQEDHSPEFYYSVRDQMEPELDSDEPNVAACARFIYLNKTCFNGLYRENSKGVFNVPVGSYKNPTICNADNLRAASEALEGVKIECRGFERIVDHAQPGDFVYFDPPYYPLNPNSFKSYTKHKFQEAEQIQLCEVATELRDKGVFVMLSNSDCPFIRDLYKDFTIQDILASRNINSNGEGRGKVKEVLILP